MRASFLRGKASQRDLLERAAGRLWLVLGLGGSDRAETEQSQRTTLELLFACFSALLVSLGLRMRTSLRSDSGPRFGSQLRTAVWLLTQDGGLAPDSEPRFGS